MKVILIFFLALIILEGFPQSEDIKDQIKEYKISYNYFIQDNDLQKAGAILAKIASLYLNEDKNDSAIYYFQLAADHYKKINDHKSLVLIYTNLGAVQQVNKKYTAAIKDFKLALSESEIVGDQKLIAIKKLDLASAYSINNNFKEAEELYRQALEIGKRNNDNDIILSTYDKMQQLFIKSNNEMMANEFVIRYNHYADSVDGSNYDIKSLLEANRKKYQKFIPQETGQVSETIDELESDPGKEIQKTQTNELLSIQNELRRKIHAKKYDEIVGKILTNPEKLPEFPGGDFSLKMYLTSILPSSTKRDKKKKDKIEVEFVINKYGFLVNPTIKKGINKSIDEEIVHVLNMMPAWIPGKDEGKKVNTRTSLSINYPFDDLNNLIEFELNRLLKKEQIILNSGNNDSISNFYIELGNVYYYSGKNEQAFNYYNKALEIYREACNLKNESDVLANIAGIYHNWIRYVEAVDYYSKSIEIKEKINDTLSLGKTMYQLGLVYMDMGDTLNALKFYEKSLVIDSLLNNNNDHAVALNNIGVIYFAKGDMGKALKYYLNALSIYTYMHNKFGSATTLNNIGNVHFKLEKYNDALNSYNKSLDLKNEINYFEGIAIALFNIGNVYYKIKNYEKAIDYFTKSIELSKIYTLKDVEWKCYQALAQVFSEQNECADVLKYNRLYSKARFYIPQDETGNPISETQVKYAIQNNKSLELEQKIGQLQQLNFAKELEINKYVEKIRDQKLIARLDAQKQQQQIEIQQIKIKRHNIQLIILIISLLIAIAVLSIIYYFLKKNQKINLILKNQKKEILEINELITEQKVQIERDANEIRDSIYYAGYIQSAILPPIEKRSELLGEHFIFYEPKNIVSGDFYWISKVEDSVILAVADCTGHGVPGAFMSMLGSSFLNEIVNKEYITHTGVILRKLRKEVIIALKQNNRNDRRDGMDISICSIDYKNKQLQFSGANNPLYIVREKNSRELDAAIKYKTENGIINEIKGDKMPIGFYERMDKFTDHEIKLEKGDCVYMFSDGYADQFGGQKGKKFMYKNFKDLLLQIYKLPCNEQKRIIQQKYIEWKGDNAQIDDVLILGFKI